MSRAPKFLDNLFFNLFQWTMKVEKLKEIFQQWKDSFTIRIIPLCYIELRKDPFAFHFWSSLLLKSFLLISLLMQELHKQWFNLFTKGDYKEFHIKSFLSPHKNQSLNMLFTTKVYCKMNIEFRRGFVFLFIFYCLNHCIFHFKWWY